MVEKKKVLITPKSPISGHNEADADQALSGKIVGLVDIYIQEDELGVPVRYGHVQNLNLVVTKSFRRRGIGSKLMEYAHPS